MDWGFVLEQTLIQALGLNAAVYAIAAIGLNMHFGYAGLLNFGQAGFVAMGAYGMGIAVNQWGYPVWVAVLMGMLFSVGFAVLLGLPTLRLRADYLAIVTIAAAEIVRLVARSTALRDITRGAEGLNEFIGPFREFNPFNPSATYGIWFVQYRGNTFFAVVIGWTLAALFVLITYLLIRSPWGRVVKAIREDELAARALGKNAYRFKMQALIIGGVMGGFAGMVDAIGKATVQPDFFGAALTFFFWLVLILGGVGRVWAPIAGSILYWGLITFVQNTGRQLVDNGVIRTTIMDTNQIDQIRFWVVGGALALLMVYRPQGIFGSREEMALDAR
ncbi:MAG: branched-chain amino acid ABC transporter permease [Acidimicrobiia bacterium]|nr:branched-chain amino acid ABC transporter permease [Acidimicrobiia bacterium]